MDSDGDQGDWERMPQERLVVRGMGSLPDPALRPAGGGTMGWSYSFIIKLSLIT